MNRSVEGARSSPYRYRWTWPHVPHSPEITRTAVSIRINLLLYAAFVGVFALPWVERATGIAWHAVGVLMAIHLGWVALSASFIAPRARTSRRAFDLQVVGNTLSGVALASAFPVLADAPGSLLWGALIFYATFNGTITDFEPSLALQAFHVGAPLATIPLFMTHGAQDWSIAGPVIAGFFAASGYHLAATSATDARRFRQVAIAAERAEAERRLARDLHDVVGSTLGTVKAYADLLTTQVPDVATPLQDVAQHGLDDLRGVIDALSPPREQGLHSAVGAIARRIVPPAIEVQLSGEWPEQVPGAVRVAAARIVQEALYNAVRHGKPTRIEIRCANPASELRVEVIDNGRGFDVDRDTDGRGIAAMKGRASELAGSVTIRSNDGGTAVVATFPAPASLAA